jgi:AraC-like DNA-binding protein
MMRDLQDRLPYPGVPPPTWAQRFRSDDLDEVRAFTSRIDGEHSRVAHDSGPLGFESILLNGETCAVAWGRANLPVTIRGALPNPVLHLGSAMGRYRVGRREYVPGPRDAIFIPSGWEFSRQGRPGWVLAIAPDPGRLLEEISARGAGRPDGVILTAQRLVINDSDRAQLLGAVASLVQAREPGAPIDTAWHLGTHLISVIADLLLQQSAVVRVLRATDARIANLENWIEANLERPITAGQLCQVAGVSRRGLEKIFESRRGMSPMRFVTERRLAAAQRLLCAAAPGDDVTRVALGLGFNHAGRFSALYKQTYGELPSQALNRASRRRC